MIKMPARSLVIALLVAGLSFVARSSASAEEMTCPEHTPVSIDIKPGDYPNKINLSSRGLVPVAVLASQDFDASLFAPEMARLADANTDMSQGCMGAVAVRRKLDDVNRDGRVDLVFFFLTQDLNFTPDTTAAMFMAHGAYEGGVSHIMGMDSVVVKP